MGNCMSICGDSHEAEAVPKWRDWNRLAQIKLYRMGDLLGQGSFSEVVAAQRLSDGVDVALKFVFLGNPLLCNPKHVQVLRREAELLSLLRHPSIVSCTHWEECPKNRMLIIEEELCRGGNLLNELISEMKEHKRAIDEELLALIVRQLLEALQHMHQRNVIHRDLKPQNIVFKNEPASWWVDHSKCVPVIIDLGLAEQITSSNKGSLYGCLGSSGYIAPEVIAGRHHSPAMDLYALGVILYMMITGNKPMSRREARDLSYYLCEADAYSNMKIDSLWITASAEARSLVVGLLERDPKRRLTAAQALRHPWVSGVLATGGRLQRVASVMTPAAQEALQLRMTESLREDELERMARHLVTEQQLNQQASVTPGKPQLGKTRSRMGLYTAPSAAARLGDTAGAHHLRVGGAGRRDSRVGALDINPTSAEVDEMVNSVRHCRLRHARTAPEEAFCPQMLLLEPVRPHRGNHLRQLMILDDIKSEGSDMGMASGREMSTMNDAVLDRTIHSPASTDPLPAQSPSQRGAESNHTANGDAEPRPTSFEDGQPDGFVFKNPMTKTPSYTTLYRILSDNARDGDDRSDDNLPAGAHLSDEGTANSNNPPQPESRPPGNSMAKVFEELTNKRRNMGMSSIDGLGNNVWQDQERYAAQSSRAQRQ